MLKIDVEKSDSNVKKHPRWKMAVGVLSLFVLVAVTSISGLIAFGNRASASSGWSWDLFDFSKLIINDAKSPSLQLKTFSFPSPQPTIPANADILDCDYPGNGPGLEGIQFDEPRILVDFAPKPPNAAVSGGNIHLWAGDETSVVLGLASIDGTQFPFTKFTSITTLHNPPIGAPYDQGGKDSAGRPMFPAIFLTDITADQTAKTGDWQQGGTPIPPHFISGTWAHSDKNGSSFKQTKPKEPKNVVNTMWTLAPEGMQPAPGQSYNDRTYFGAEVRWNIDQLLAEGKIQPGKTYRAQFMVRDGDGESDVAQGCVTIQT